MADSFDPYYKWLGISPKDQPPNHYRLLAIEAFESDPDVIEGAADRLMAHLRTFQAGPHSAHSQKLLNECAAARVTLLDPQKRAEYDRQLRQKLSASTAPPGQGRGDLPLPPEEGRGEGGSPRSRPHVTNTPQATAPQPTRVARPMPQAASMPAAEVTDFQRRDAAATAASMPMAAVVPLDVVHKEDVPPAVRRRVTRKTPLWRQPAVLGTAGAIVIFAGIAYVLTGGGKLPADLVSTTSNPNTVPAQPPKVEKTKLPLPPGEGRGGRGEGGSPRSPSQSPAPPTSQPDFEILAASWGADDKWVEVTEGLRGQVKDNRLMMIVWSDLFGKPADPAPGVEKKLRIRYRARGKEYTAEYFDSWFVYLDGNPPSPPTDSPGTLEIVEARYGAGGTFLDVLPELRKHVADGRLSVAADQFAATTAAELEKNGIGPDTFKILWVRYRDRTGEHSDYAWYSQLLTIDTRLPRAAGRPVDLLRLIEVPRHVVYGDWSTKDGKLLAPPQVAARVQIPYRVPSDYALSVVVESDDQMAQVTAGLVVGGRQVIAVLDSGDNLSFSGMALVNRLWYGDDKNPTKTWRLARMLEQGRPNTLTYIVRPNSVRVLRDGAEIVRWSGDPATFSIPDTWEVPDTQKLFLQSYNVPYRITKVELTPLAPDTTPMLTLGDSGLPVDVLKSIDLDRDRRHGDWQYDGQALVSSANGWSSLQLPALISDNYQLDLVAQRESGNDGPGLTIPIAGAQVTVGMDAYEGKSGLQKIDDQAFDVNETKYEGPIFADGKRHLVRLTVQKNHVRLFCDGKSIVDWTGDVNRLKPTESLPYSDRISLGTWQSSYRFTQIKLRALRGDEPDQTPPSLAGESTDLLKQIDVKRDAVNGKWRMEDGVLVSPKQNFSKLLLPPPPSEEYRLRMVVERIDGQFGIGPVLVVGGRQVAAAIDGWDGNHSGLEAFDGKSCNDNPTTHRGKLLTAGQAFDLVFTVRRNSIQATIDGTEILNWTGDPSHLSLLRGWDLPDPSRLGLLEHGTICRISKLEITPLSSAPPRTPAPLVQPAPPSVKPTEPGPGRKFADLASGKETRLPIPDDDAQKEARKEMQKKLGNSLKGARTPDQKRSLAKELSEKAAVGDDKAYAYVLFKQSIDLAEAAGDLELAWQTADRLAGLFAVDRMTLRSQSLAEIGKAVKSPDGAWQLTDAACRLMLTALLAGDAAAVKKVGSQAQSFAKRTGDRGVQKDVNSRASDAVKLAGELEAVIAAREKLKTSPADPQANFTVGHFDLCAAGDFDGALPKLAKGSDEGWKKLAAEELGLDTRQGTARGAVRGRPVTRTEATDAERALAVADDWWSRADDEPWPAKHHLRMRAARWYGAAYRSLVDAGRVRAAERLKMLLATDDGFPHWELFERWSMDQPEGDVVRVGRQSSLQTFVEYTGSLEVTLVARTTGTDIHLGAHNWSWNWKFKVVPNVWHTLKFVINPFSRTVFVDGVLADTDAWKTPRQLNSAPVSVYVTDDEVVEIRKFIVRGTD